MSFESITPEEYDRLVKNKNRIFNLTFRSPERINKYRNDENIYNNIKIEEKRKKKIKDYNKTLNYNLNKYFIQNDDKKKILKTANYFD